MAAGRLILGDDVLVLDVDAGVLEQVVDVDVYRVGELVGLGRRLTVARRSAGSTCSSS